MQVSNKIKTIKLSCNVLDVMNKRESMKKDSANKTESLQCGNGTKMASMVFSKTAIFRSVYSTSYCTE